VVKNRLIKNAVRRSQVAVPIPIDKNVTFVLVPAIQAEHFSASKQVKRIIPIRLALSVKRGHVCALTMAKIALFPL